MPRESENFKDALLKSRQAVVEEIKRSLAALAAGVRIPRPPSASCKVHLFTSLFLPLRYKVIALKKWTFKMMKWSSSESKVEKVLTAQSIAKHGISAKNQK